ncbi:MAG: CalY family protein [Methanomicrobiales archaeon]|nr:CalY family protein [Methanomicrobiales archaeon]
MVQRKALWSVALLGAALLLISTGTYAYFSDVETAAANTFTAGTLDLQVGAASPCVETISVATLAPGATGTAATWVVQNTGNINGDLRVTIGAITNNENTRLEMETDAGDATSGVAQGEMGANLNVSFWMDVDSSGGWNTGDYYLSSAAAIVPWGSGAALPSGAWDALDDYASDDFVDVQTARGNGNIGTFKVSYELPTGTTNVVQTDSAVFDITFTLDQS